MCGYCRIMWARHVLICAHRLWLMCCCLVLSIPVVQKLPEFLEILVPPYHPEQEFSQQSETQRLQRDIQNVTYITNVYVYVSVADTHRLSFRPLVSLWPRQSHSTSEAPFTWRSTLASKTLLTLNG